jgi:rRNA-processing protein FCF1
MAPDRNGSPDRVAVLLDTNALMIPARFRIDIFEELRNLIGAYEPLILNEVRAELEGLARGRGKDAAAARYGLMLAEKCKTVTADDGVSVDDRIVSYARSHRCMVFSDDRALRNRLLDLQIPVISLIGKKKLDILRR